MRRSGFSFKKALARVASTRETSCGEALSVWRARGTEEPSANAMIFVPLPRLVFPTRAPLFWLQRTSRLCSTPRALSLHALRDLRPGLRVRRQEHLPQPISGSDGGRFDRGGSARVDLSRALRYAVSTRWR